MSQLKPFILICCSLLTFVSHLAIANAQPAIHEYTLKAGFLYNFALLTQWPETDSQHSFNLCYSGSDDIGEYLNSIEGKHVSKKTILVKKLDNTEQAKDCHLLFISKTSYLDSSTMLQKIKTLPILTVTDDMLIAKAGVTILLRPEGKRLVFEINTESAKRSNLNIRSRLLRLSR